MWEGTPHVFRGMRPQLIPFLRSQPDLMMQIVEILCSRLRWTTEQVQDVSFLDLPTRLAKAVLRLVGENEGAVGDGKLTITRPESQPGDRQIARKHQQAITDLGQARLGSFAARRSYGVAAGEASRRLLPKRRSSMPPERDRIS